MKISLIVYGCKVNQAEFQKLEKSLKNKGYEITNNLNEADCWIINTCAVTYKAEIQSRQIINKAIKYGKKCFVTGCYVNLYYPQSRENLKFFLNDEKDSIINYFSSIISTNFSKKIDRHRAIIKVQDGCNNYCSYCIVPYLRGKPKSYELKNILREIKNYESDGINEIILSGINLGLYGIDQNNNSNLNSLIKVILKNTSISKIRLSSIEVNHINDEFIELIGETRICKHLHIPLQHGSDRILHLMNRKYSIAQFAKIIEKILKHYPHISIGTDLIVGFPYENEDDFRETLKFLDEVSFSYIHVFKYSKRPYTQASKLSNHVPDYIKKERAIQLNDIARHKKRKYLEKFIGHNAEIIIENKKNDLLTGTSDNYIKCIIKEKGQLSPGELVKGRINYIDGERAFVSLIIKNKNSDSL